MQRPSNVTLLSRAVRLKCPRCGEAAMFTGLFAMRERCPACGHKFDREPGYFLGSIYINYGITSLLITLGYVTLRFGWNLPNAGVLTGLLAFCVLFPTFFFRYARALWVALDCVWDRSIFESQPTPPPTKS